MPLCAAQSKYITYHSTYATGDANDVTKLGARRRTPYGRKEFCQNLLLFPFDLTGVWELAKNISGGSWARHSQCSAPRYHCLLPINSCYRFSHQFHPLIASHSPSLPLLLCSLLTRTIKIRTSQTFMLHHLTSCMMQPYCPPPLPSPPTTTTTLKLRM